MRTDHHVEFGTFKAKVSRGIGDSDTVANIWAALTSGRRLVSIGSKTQWSARGHNHVYVRLGSPGSEFYVFVYPFAITILSLTGMILRMRMALHRHDIKPIKRSIGSRCTLLPEFRPLFTPQSAPVAPGGWSGEVRIHCIGVLMVLDFWRRSAHLLCPCPSVAGVGFGNKGFPAFGNAHYYNLEGISI
jgi:hypothetical protein